MIADIGHDVVRARSRSLIPVFCASTLYISGAGIIVMMEEWNENVMLLIIVYYAVWL